MSNSKLLLFEKSTNKIGTLAMSKLTNLLNRCTIKITFFQQKITILYVRRWQEMILWFIAGLILCILCVLLMLATIKGGHRIRGHGYEQKLYFRSKVNTQNIEDSIKKEVKKTTRTKRNPRTRRNQCLPISAHKWNRIRKYILFWNCC